VLNHLRLSGTENPEPETDDAKKMWTFLCGFFALLDRGRVRIVGTEDGQ
jgi:hypothetical protein